MERYDRRATRGGTAAADIKARKRRNLLLTVIAVLLILVTVLLCLRSCNAGIPEVDPRYVRDSESLAGLIEGKTEEEIMQILNMTVEEGMFNVSMNTMVEVDEESHGHVQIENVAANRFLMRVDIVVTDSVGTEVNVYESGIIDPGYCIDYATFKIMPPKGVIDAVAVFSALDPETLEKVGQTRLNIILLTGVTMADLNEATVDEATKIDSGEKESAMPTPAQAQIGE